MKSLIIILSLFVAAEAQAVCKIVEVCEGFKQNCRSQQICDSKTDLPAIGLPAFPCNTDPGLKPMPDYSNPPLGASSCDHYVVNCQWQRLCN